jgi:hypothetical protein
MNEYNFIGDIAGQYNALILLLKKMPDAMPFSVGDKNDRGPKSRDVINFFKDKKSILGNHEHMMIDYYLSKTSPGYTSYYEYNLWPDWNGGGSTLDNYLGEEDKFKEDIEYLMTLPLYHEEENLIVTHAPINPSITFKMFLDIGTSASDTRCDTSVLWNRGGTRPIKGKFQIHGHNAKKTHEFYIKDNNCYGVNLDSSRGKILTGLHWPSMKIYTQEY